VKWQFVREKNRVGKGSNNPRSKASPTYGSAPDQKGGKSSRRKKAELRRGCAVLLGKRTGQLDEKKLKFEEKLETEDGTKRT